MYPHFIDTETGPVNFKVFCPSTYNEFGKKTPGIQPKVHNPRSDCFFLLSQPV